MSNDTKAIDRSMKFYRNYDSKWRMQDYAQKLALENKSFLNFKDAIERFKENYAKYMKEHFDSSILFSDEVYQFAYDTNGNLLELDELIYQKLRLCASKCRVLAYEDKIQMMGQD